MKRATEDLLFLLDEHLATKKEKTFTQAELAEVFGLTGRKATELIQTFLRVQKDEGWSEILNRRIYRVPGTRTTNAVWTHGDRSKDVRNVVAQVADDWKTRAEWIDEYFESVKTSNPQAAKAIRQASLLISTAVSVLEHAEA